MNQVERQSGSAPLIITLQVRPASCLKASSFVLQLVAALSPYCHVIRSIRCESCVVRRRRGLLGQVCRDAMREIGRAWKLRLTTVVRATSTKHPSAERCWRQASLLHFSLRYTFVFCNLGEMLVGRTIQLLLRLRTGSSTSTLEISIQRCSSLILSLFTCSSSWCSHRAGHFRRIFFDEAAF